MAGGLGMRLRPLTSIIPKPLLPLGDRSVVEVALMNLARAGVTVVVMCIKYMSEYFESHFEKQPLNGLTKQDLANLIHAQEQKSCLGCVPWGNTYSCNQLEELKRTNSSTSKISASNA